MIIIFICSAGCAHPIRFPNRISRGAEADPAPALKADHRLGVWSRGVRVVARGVERSRRMRNAFFQTSGPRIAASRPHSSGALAKCSISNSVMTRTLRAA